jgi:hypothetical protein
MDSVHTSRICLPSKVGELLALPFERGQLLDRKWALEVAGVIPSDRLNEIIRTAFSSDSQLLRDVANKQAARLSPIPNDILKSVRTNFLHMACNGVLGRGSRTRVTATVFFLAHIFSICGTETEQAERNSSVVSKSAVRSWSATVFVISRRI